MTESIPKKRVCLLGAGSYGTAVARIVASNITRHADEFHSKLNLWVRRTELADQINATNENSQYLPGAPIPSNLVANSNLEEVVKDADIIVIGVPHTYISESMIDTIKEKSNHNANTIHVVSLAKGIYTENDTLIRVSQRLHQKLNGGSNGNGGNSPRFVISVLMGANVYDQMGRDEFAEVTLGCPTMDSQLYNLFNDLDRFHVSMTRDVSGVEFCAVLKNVVALGVGYAEGLGLGSNTKAAIIRRGLREIVKFAKHFGEDVKDDTFFQSAGIADLMTTCFAGRGQRLAAAFVKDNKGRGWAELEKEVLNGMQIPDWHNVNMVFKFLDAEDRTGDFPFFSIVYLIGFANVDPGQIVEVLKTEHEVI